MVAAITLTVILMVSLAIVRAAGVALRLTGMPEEAARFQAISALTGTGFTTTEAEITMHHPIRRRILVMLMFFGHLGVVSMASTVIIGVTSAEGGANVSLQIVVLILALIAVIILASSKWLDLAMCGLMATVMIRLGWLQNPGYEVLYEHPNGEQLIEHIFHEGRQFDQYEGAINVLAINGVDTGDIPTRSLPHLRDDDRILCFGIASEQVAFANFANAHSN